MGSTPGLGQSPGEENSYPLQYSGLENSMDRGALQAIGYGVAKSWTPLRDFDTHTHTTHTHTHTHTHGLPRWLSGEESTCQCRRRVSIPGSGRSPGEGNGNPLRYSCLGNPMDRGGGASVLLLHHGAWWARVQGVTKSLTGLRNWAHTNTYTYTHIYTDAQTRIYIELCVCVCMLLLLSHSSRVRLCAPP